MGNRDNIIFTEQVFRNTLTHIVEVNDVESDIADITNRVDNISDLLDDDIGRMEYVRSLTAEFLELFLTLTGEINDSGTEIPKTMEMMSKIMGRKERKRYYMSKFRL